MRVFVKTVLATLLAAGCSSDPGNCVVDAATTDSAPAGPGQRVFISSKEYPADFMKGETDSLVDVGTRMCTELATAAGLGGGPWRAWLSSTTVNARDVVTGPGPFYDMAKKVVFPDRFELLGGAPGPALTETGAGLPGSVGGMVQTYYMLTGTTNSGRYDKEHGNCDDWTNLQSVIFAPPPGNRPFSECINSSCSGRYCSASPGHIYCFEVR